MKLYKCVWVSIAILVAITSLMAPQFTLAAEVQADDWQVADVSGTASIVSGMSGRAVTVVFSAINDASVPPPASTQIHIGGSDPANLFSGDYISRELSGVRFRIAGDGNEPNRIELYLEARLPNGENRRWSYRDIGVSENAGDWTVIRIPLDSSQGWTRHYQGDRHTDEGFWNHDLQYVESMYISVVRNGNVAQSYSIADFFLVGNGTDAITAPARLSLIEDYFGVNDIDLIDRTLDSNGNGMSDFDMLRAGLDPRDPTAVFATQVRRGESGNAINWPGVLGGRYAILRSNNLIDGFSVIPAAADVRAAFTGEQTFVDDNPVDGAPNFYKVIKW